MIDPVIGWVGGKPRLRKLTAEECATLIQQLTHRKSRIRWMAADLLGKQRVTESVAPLMHALQDSHWLVRSHAAKALGRIGDSRSVDALCAAMQDEHISVRRRAVTALGQLHDERVIPLLLHVLQQDRTLWSEVADGLVNFATPRAAYALMRATTTHEYEPYSSVAVQLGQAFTPVLLGLLKYVNAPLQSRIVTLLGQVGDQRAIPLLRALSNHCC